MNHDPLCPSVTACDCRHDECCFCDSDLWCMCPLIEKVRADTLDKARQLITALACFITIAEGHCEECEQYREVLACIESLRSEQ